MPQPEASGPAAPVSAVAMLLAAARVLGQIAKVIRNRRAVNSLRELDERALKDIGLTRADVEGALSLPLYRDPSLILAGNTRGRGMRSLPGREPVADHRPVALAAAAEPHCA